MYLLVHQQPKLLGPSVICSFGSDSNGKWQQGLRTEQSHANIKALAREKNIHDIKPPHLNSTSKHYKTKLFF